MVLFDCSVKHATLKSSLLLTVKNALSALAVLPGHAESAVLLVDDVLPHVPMRQLSPYMACSRATQEMYGRYCQLK